MTSKCPSLKDLETCRKNEICSWNSKTSKCRKTRVCKKKETPPAVKKETPPSMKKEISPPKEKESPRISKKVKTFPITFLFKITGGKKVDGEEVDWKPFPANKLSKEAKETFKLGVINQLHLNDGIREDELSYNFKKEGIVVKTKVEFNIRSKSEESDEMIEYIEFVNDKTIWQTFFKEGELDVESDGKYYTFVELILIK